MTSSSARQTGTTPGGGQITPSWFDHVADHAGPSASAHTTAAGAPAQTGADLSHDLIGRTSIALVTVIGVILVCAWALKRLGLQRDKAGRTLPIVASRSLGQRERVVIVEVEDEWLVLGVTPQHITALHRRPAPVDQTDGPATPAAGVSDSRPSFGRALAENVSRLTGRSTP